MNTMIIFTLVIIIGFFAIACLGFFLDIIFFKRQIKISNKLEKSFDENPLDPFNANSFNNFYKKPLDPFDENSFKNHLHNIGIKPSDAVYTHTLSVKSLISQGASVAAADLADHMLRERHTKFFSQSHQFAMSVLLIVGIFGSLMNFSHILPDTGLVDVVNKKGLDVEAYQKSTAELPTKLDQAFWPAGSAILCILILSVIRHFFWELYREKSLHAMVNTTHEKLIPFFTETFLQQHPLTKIIGSTLKKSTSDFSQILNQATQKFTYAIIDLNQSTQKFTKTVDNFGTFSNGLIQTATKLETATNSFATATDKASPLIKSIEKLDNTMQQIGQIADNFHYQTIEIQNITKQFNQTTATFSQQSAQLTKAIENFSEVTKTDSPMIQALATLFDNIKIVDKQYQDVLQQLVQVTNLIGQEQTQDSELQDKIVELVEITQQATQTTETVILNFDQRNLAANQQLYDELISTIKDLPDPITDSMQALDAQVEGLKTAIDNNKQQLTIFTNSTNAQNQGLDKLTKGIPVTTDIIISQDLQKELNKSQNYFLSLEQTIQNLNTAIDNNKQQLTIFTKSTNTQNQRLDKLTKGIPVTTNITMSQDVQNKLSESQNSLLSLEQAIQTLNTEIKALRQIRQTKTPTKSWSIWPFKGN